MLHGLLAKNAVVMCSCVLIVTIMLRAMKKQSHNILEQRRPALVRGLENFGDFYLELKWDFHSWCMCILYSLCENLE